MSADSSRRSGSAGSGSRSRKTPEGGGSAAAATRPEPPDTPSEDLPQDPGIPGWKTPEQLPPQDEPEVERVPDSGMPDVDDEGQMAPTPSEDG